MLNELLEDFSKSLGEECFYESYGDSPYRKIPQLIKDGVLTEKAVKETILSKLGDGVEKDCSMLILYSTLEEVKKRDTYREVMPKLSSNFVEKLAKSKPELRTTQDFDFYEEQSIATLKNGDLKSQLAVIDSLDRGNIAAFSWVSSLGAALYDSTPDLLIDVLNSSEDLLLQYFLTFFLKGDQLDDLLLKIISPEVLLFLCYRRFYNKNTDSVNKLNILKRSFGLWDVPLREIFLKIFNEYPYRSRNIQNELGQVLAGEDLTLSQHYINSVGSIEKSHSQSGHIEDFIKGYASVSGDDKFFELLKIFHQRRESIYFIPRNNREDTECVQTKIEFTDLFHTEFNYYIVCSETEVQERLDSLLFSIQEIRKPWYRSGTEFTSYVFFLLSEIYILLEAINQRSELFIIQVPLSAVCTVIDSEIKDMCGHPDDIKVAKETTDFTLKVLATLKASSA